MSRDDGTLPPHDLAAEAAVLSCVLVDGRRLPEVQLQPEHFFSESHRRIWEACLGVHAVGGAPDIVTVGGHLRDSGRIAQVGGMAYLTEILNASPHIPHPEDYAKRVLEKYRLRSLVSELTKLAAAARSGAETADALVERARTLIGVQSLGSSPGSVGYHDLVREFAQHRDSSKVPTGFEDLDTMLCGGYDVGLHLIACRPSVGKTALSLCIGLNAEKKHDHQVLFCSLEMPRVQIIGRILAMERGTPTSSLRVAQAPGPDQRRHFFVADRGSQGVGSIYQNALGRARAERRPLLLIVDYLQLVKPPQSQYDRGRTRDIGEIARAFKIMSSELKIPILLLSQLNRALEQRDNKRPVLADLRDSGEIEEHADTVAFVYREDYVRRLQGNPLRDGKAELILAKNRNGPVGTAHVGFEESLAKFYNPSKDILGMLPQTEAQERMLS